MTATLDLVSTWNNAQYIDHPSTCESLEKLTCPNESIAAFFASELINAIKPSDY